MFSMEKNPNFCEQCGTQLGMGEKFCPACGRPVFQEDAPGVMNSRMSVQHGAPVQTMPGGGVQQESVGAQQESVKSGRNDIIWKNTEGGKGKKVGIIASLCVVLVVAIVVATILMTGGKDTRLSRTVMIYMIGSNLESEDASASLDIKEMMEAKYDTDSTNVLVYTGGARKWALGQISANENAVFEVKGGEINKVKVYEKKVMTRPETLTEFVDFAYENYTTDLYDLILWDHGGGPIAGFGFDENSLSGAPMKISELSGALGKTNLIKSGKKFDLIGFDACLMGSVEVAYALSDYGDYMVASEEIEPGRGWNYAFLDIFSKDSKDTSTVAFGRQIVDSYIAHYDNYNYKVDLSLALVDLNKVKGLSSAVDSLFSNVKEEVNVANFSDYSRTMTRSKVYGYLGDSGSSFDLVDLMDLCDSLKDSHAESVEILKRELGETVLYSQSNMEDTNGLSVYFVNYNKENANKMVESYKDVTVSDNYYNFLTEYAGLINGSPMVSRTIYEGLPEKKEGSNIFIDLPDELRDNYQSGEVIIFRKLGDNDYMPVYRSSEVALSGNTLSVSSLDLQFVVEVTTAEGNTEYGWATMAEKERTEEYADYVTFGVLDSESSEDSLGLGMKSYDMYIRVPKGEKEAIVRDIRVRSDNDLASKMSFDPDKISEIDFINGAYKLYNDDGVLDYNFSTNGTNYGISANLKKGDSYKIKLVGLDFDFGDMFSDEFSNTKDYYAGFVVHDTQGRTHRLNLVHINN